MTGWGPHLIVMPAGLIILTTHQVATPADAAVVNLITIILYRRRYDLRCRLIR
jgi:hypothetical protein